LSYLPIQIALHLDLDRELVNRLPHRAIPIPPVVPR